MTYNNMQTIYGMPVHIARGHPRRKLSTNLAVSDEFRKTFDAWLLEFFGWNKPLVGPDEILRVGNTLHMRQETWERVKSAVKSENNKR